MNDDGKEDSEILLRDKKGYLNAGIRWSAIENLMLERISITHLLLLLEILRIFPVCLIIPLNII